MFKTKLTEANAKVAHFYNENLVDGKFVLPANLEPYAGLIVAILRVIKIFANDATDAIIDIIIGVIEAI